MAKAEDQLRVAGYDHLVDEIRDEVLPRGVLDGRQPEDRWRWSYDVLKTYEEVFLDDIVGFGEEVCDTITDGRRHTHERKQEREWKQQSERE